MTETPQQEVYRLQIEISKRLSRINQILGGPDVTDVVVGTTSTRMRRYMNAIEHPQPKPGGD
jgi:hypothetical protein